MAAALPAACVAPTSAEMAVLACRSLDAFLMTFFVAARNGGVGNRRKVRVGDGVVAAAKGAAGVDVEDGVEVGADTGTRPEGASGMGGAAAVVTVVVGAEVADGEVVQDG